MKTPRFAKKKDVIVLVLLILFAFSLLLLLRHKQQQVQNPYVKISYKGDVFYYQPLDQNVRIVSPYNTSLIIQVKDGTAWFVQSDCPDQICVNTGKIHSAGEYAACAPNRTILLIEGEIPPDTPDANT